MVLEVPGEWFAHADKLEAAGKRCVAAAEIFSGAHTWTDEWQAAGLEALTYDIVDEPELQDATTVVGIDNLVGIASRVTKKGVVHLAPRCSTYVFINLSTSGRSRLNPEGDLSKPQVVEANGIAKTVAQIITFLTARDVFYVIEQPRNSMFYHLDVVSEALSSTGAVRLSFCMGDLFGGQSAKPTELWGTAPYLLSVSNVPKILREQTVQLARCRDGKVTGMKHLLKKSQVYPLEYGRRIAYLHHVYLAGLSLLALWNLRSLPPTVLRGLVEFLHGDRATSKARQRLMVAKGFCRSSSAQEIEYLRDLASASAQKLLDIRMKAASRSSLILQNESVLEDLDHQAVAGRLGRRSAVALKKPPRQQEPRNNTRNCQGRVEQSQSQVNALGRGSDAHEAKYHKKDVGPPSVRLCQPSVVSGRTECSERHDEDERDEDERDEYEEMSIMQAQSLAGLI